MVSLLGKSIVFNFLDKEFVKYSYYFLVLSFNGKNIPLILNISLDKKFDLDFFFENWNTFCISVLIQYIQIPLFNTCFSTSKWPL